MPSDPVSLIVWTSQHAGLRVSVDNDLPDRTVHRLADGIRRAAEGRRVVVDAGSAAAARIIARVLTEYVPGDRVAVHRRGKRVTAQYVIASPRTVDDARARAWARGAGDLPSAESEAHDGE